MYWLQNVFENSGGEISRKNHKGVLDRPWAKPALLLPDAALNISTTPWALVSETGFLDFQIFRCLNFEISVLAKYV